MNTFIRCQYNKDIDGSQPCCLEDEGEPTESARENTPRRSTPSTICSNAGNLEAIESDRLSIQSTVFGMRLRHTKIILTQMEEHKKPASDKHNKSSTTGVQQSITAGEGALRAKERYDHGKSTDSLASRSPALTSTLSIASRTDAEQDDLVKKIQQALAEQAAEDAVSEKQALPPRAIRKVEDPGDRTECWRSFGEKPHRHVLVCGHFVDTRVPGRCGANCQRTTERTALPQGIRFSCPYDSCRRIREIDELNQRTGGKGRDNSSVPRHQSPSRCCEPAIEDQIAGSSESSLSSLFGKDNEPEVLVPRNDPRREAILANDSTEKSRVGSPMRDMIYQPLHEAIFPAREKYDHLAGATRATRSPAYDADYGMWDEPDFTPAEAKARKASRVCGDYICNGCREAVYEIVYSCLVCDDHVRCGPCWVDDDHNPSHEMIPMAVDRSRVGVERRRAAFGNESCAALSRRDSREEAEQRAKGFSFVQAFRAATRRQRRQRADMKAYCQGQYHIQSRGSVANAHTKGDRIRINRYVAEKGLLPVKLGVVQGASARITKPGMAHSRRGSLVGERAGSEVAVNAKKTAHVLAMLEEVGKDAKLKVEGYV